ncbi:MAG: hypothetical protein AAFQ41_05295 [Cyanobacteria bacterium J06623_7]
MRHNFLRLLLFIIGASIITWSNPLYINAGNAQISHLASTPPESNSANVVSELPAEVKTAVINYAIKHTGKTVSMLKITEARSQQWSDGCLGLGQAHEICLQAITPGYRITLTDGSNAWAYRTDSRGNSVRLESQTKKL